MSEFQDSKKVKSRLLAYYKGLGKNNFPINLENSSNYINKLDEILELGDEEELIAKFKSNTNMEIFISTREIYMLSNKNLIKIPFQKLSGVFLNRDFKSLNTPKELNFLVQGDKLYKIKFDNLNTLTLARNEIYRIVNTSLKEWVGSKFRADEMVFKGEEVNL